MTLAKQTPSKKIMIRIITIMCELAKDSLFRIHAQYLHLTCLIAKRGTHIYMSLCVNTLFTDLTLNVFCCQYSKVNDSFCVFA